MEKLKLPHNHNLAEKGQQIIDSIPDDETVISVAEAMKQLGDPTRLKIFWILCHTEECVLDIGTMISMTSPAVSHHLRILKEAGLLSTRREGKEMYYKAATTVLVEKMHKIIEDIASIKCPQNTK